MGPIHIKLAIANVLRQFSSSDPRCWVKEKVKIGYIHSKIHINPAAGGDQFPVLMQFEADETFDSVGFLPLDDKGKIPQHTTKGHHCGGCFFLESDVGTKTLLIRNDGWNDGPKGKRNYKYRFEIWSGGKKIGFDPQIYNQGVGTWPKLRWLWCRFLKIFA